MDMNKFWTFVL